MVSKIKELLTRGVEEIITKKELEEKLKSGRKMKIYLGVDPSSSIIHLGHAVALRKLREFQKLGHQTILLIGDFTGQIGDPTGLPLARQPLTHRQVLKNAATYKDQAAKILDFKLKTNPVRIEYNSKWLKKLNFEDLIKLGSHFTVQQMLVRDMYQERLKKEKAIALHEFFYPLMQGYDSIALDVDMEIGGSDQLFNMKIGRELMKKLRGKTKVVMTLKLLRGPDLRKMSKSFNNFIGVKDEPDKIYGKIMSLPDDLIIEYFTLCTNLSMKEIKEIERKIKKDKLNPRDTKARLAREVTTIYHSKSLALKAEKEFNRIFREKKIPEKIKKYQVKNVKYQIIDLLIKTKLASSKSEGRRLIEQGGVKIDGKPTKDWKKEIRIKNKMVLQVGKRRFIKLITK